METSRKIKVKSIKYLQELISNNHNDFLIALKYGLISRKHITVQKNGTFRVYNHIDDTKQLLTEKGLFTLSNIGEAIKKGAFINEQ